jgi:hypothetical protein
LLLVVCGVAVVAEAATPARASPVDPATQRITFRGVGQFGVFDPSVADDPATGRLWMSFSRVDPSKHSKWGVGLHLAYSDDGESWRDAGALQKFTDVVVGPLATTPPEAPIDANAPGTWQNETSTLVYDRDAPDGQRWKLFWHQSLWVNDAPRYASYSWIALRMADRPENLAQAPAVKLFSGYLAKRDGDVDTAPAFAPIAGPAAIELNNKDPQLGACVFGEPGAISASGGLYLTLDCQWLGSIVAPHTVLLRCAYPDCNPAEAPSWTVVNRLTDPRDAQRIDERYKGFGGTALAEHDGKFYLLATPVDTNGNRYDGCNVYRFNDLASGTLERSRGRLVVAAQVRGIPGTHHGACAYHPQLKNGILLSQLVITAAPAMFQIRRSGVEMP